MKAMLGFYNLLFFSLPVRAILVMAVTAFNPPNYPQRIRSRLYAELVVKLWNDRAMTEGLTNSIIIGVCVVAISVPSACPALSS